MNDKLDYARKILAFVDILPKLVSLYIFLSILPKVPDIMEVLIEYNTAKSQEMSIEPIGRVWYKGKLCYRHELPINSVSSGGGQEMKIHNLLSGWPVEGKITSGFGPRRHPITRRWSHHNGIDIQVSTGTPVRAVASGTVEFAGWKSGGMGNAVIVKHGNGLSTQYGHLSRVKVRKGNRVKKGQIIAYSGNSGRSTGPHLYFEVKQNGKAIDPTPCLKEEVSAAEKPEQIILVSSGNE